MYIGAEIGIPHPPIQEASNQQAIFETSGITGERTSRHPEERQIEPSLALTGVSVVSVAMARAIVRHLRIGIAACDEQAEKTDYSERT